MWSEFSDDDRAAPHDEFPGSAQRGQTGDRRSQLRSRLLKIYVLDIPMSVMRRVLSTRPHACTGLIRPGLTDNHNLVPSRANVKGVDRDLRVLAFR